MVTLGPVAWVVPTIRACRAALVTATAVAAVSAVAAIVTAVNDVALPAAHVWLALAALAVAASTPHDPAAGLLAALPTGPGTRSLHRGALGTVTALGAWLLAGWSVELLVASRASEVVVGGSPPALLALIAVGVAAGSWFGPWGACAPFALVAAGHIVEDAGRFDDALRLWRTEPWIVVATALAAAVVRHRPAGRRPDLSRHTHASP